MDHFIPIYEKMVSFGKDQNLVIYKIFKIKMIQQLKSILYSK